MATCIEQRGPNSWRVTVSAGYKDGKQQRIRRSFRFPEDWPIEKQRREVDKKAALLCSAAYRNENGNGGMIFSKYVELWIKEYAEKNMEPKTLHECLTKLNLRIIPFFGKYQLSEIKPLVVTKFINNLAGTIIDKKTKRKLTPQSITHYISLLSSMFSMAIRWELMISNPCSKVIKPKIQNLEKPMLNESEAVQLIVELDKAPLKFQCIAYIAIMTGLRLGEIVALKWQDVDFDQKEINVCRARSYVPGMGGFDKVPKTNTSRRRISVSQVLLVKLKAHATEQQQAQTRLKKEWHNNDYLFTTWNGEPMGHNTPSRWFRDFLEVIRARQQTEQKAARIPVAKQKLMPLIRFHDLRHLHATLLIGQGVDILTVSKRLGHARASTTANIYCHPLKANDVRAAEVIESVLFN